MRLSELTKGEQAKARRHLRDAIRSIDRQPFRRVKAVVDGHETAGLDEALIEELRMLWKSLDRAYSSDFELPEYVVKMIEHDRRMYLAPDEELDHPDEMSRLTGRIHHQRRELRALQRCLVNGWRYRYPWYGSGNWQHCDESEVQNDVDPSGDIEDLRGRMRRQRRQLRYAHSVIDLQRKEMEELLHRLVIRAATS